MESRAKFLGHAIHPIMVVFPLGLLTTGVVFDVIYLAGGDPSMVTVSYWMIVAGIIGGLLSAPFGWIDWFAVPRGTRARSIGLIHGLGNIVVLLLFAGSWWLRQGGDHRPGTMGYALSFAGLALTGLTGWLGGELVGRLGVGVDDDADLNASNSLAKGPVIGRR